MSTATGTELPAAPPALSLPPEPREIAPIVQVEAVTVMANRWFVVREDRVTFTKSGAEGRHVVFEPACGERAGSVVLAVRPGASGDRVALVHQFRYPLGVWSWELPRGAADAEDTDAVMTATRELVEETGALPVRATTIGSLHPDTGPMRSVVDVVAVHVEDVETAALDDEEIETVRWVTVPALLAAIADGSIKCGLTIAAVLQALLAGAITCEGQIGARVDAFA